MKDEIRVFFTAIMFYTRIPCPRWVDHSEDYITRSVRYFPLIGWVVGTIAASGYLLGAWLVSPLFGIVFSFIVSVLVTGAFHEDGFADVCDGFGGGWTKKQILEIMKDSRVGTYGVVGLVLIYLFKTSLLLALADLVNGWVLAMVFVGAHAASRFMATTFVFTHNYVSESDSSKSKPVAKQSGYANLVMAAFFGLLPVLLLSYMLDNYLFMAVLPLLYLVKMALGNYFTKWIGGYTGDCLGALQQVTEAAFYCFLLLIWKFIL